MFPEVDKQENIDRKQDVFAIMFQVDKLENIDRSHNVSVKMFPEMKKKKH